MFAHSPATYGWGITTAGTTVAVHVLARPAVLLTSLALWAVDNRGTGSQKTTSARPDQSLLLMALVLMLRERRQPGTPRHR